MMRGIRQVALTAVALLTAGPLAAHHSFAAEFDVKKQVTLQGVVTKIEWSNPHTYFYMDLKVGDQITVTGYRARDGASIASAREVVLPDGHKIFAGSAADGGPYR